MILSWLELRISISLFNFKKWAATSSSMSSYSAIDFIYLFFSVKSFFDWLNLCLKDFFCLRLYFEGCLIECFNNTKYPIKNLDFSANSSRKYNLVNILEVLCYDFYIIRVFDTTTTIIETIKVPQIATNKIITLPNGVWG